MATRQDKRLYIIEIVYKNRNIVRQITKDMKDIQKAQRDGATATDRVTKANDRAGISFGKLLKRATVIIPTWLALRSAMMAVINTFHEGFRAIETLDKALQKARQVIHTTSGTAEEGFNRMKQAAIELSRETGKSVETTVNAFYRFGTVGLTVEESVAGMEAATRGAVAMFGDADKIAKTLALTYKLLGDTVDQTVPIQERQTLMMAQLQRLWQDNAFELDGFASAMNNFLPTAKSLNFSYKESISLLAALSSSAVQGSRGGRLLRSNVQKLVENLDQLAGKLGLAVNPAMESTNDTLIRVFSKIRELYQSGDTVKAADAINSIFGGVRGGEVARAISSNFDVYLNNIKALNEDSETLLENFSNRVKDVEESAFSLIEQIKNIKRENSRAFIVGLTGAKDYEDALKRILDIMKDLTPVAKQTGEALRATFNLKRGGLAGYLAREYSDAAKTIKDSKEINEIGQKINDVLLGKADITTLEEYIALLQTGIQPIKPDVIGDTNTYLEVSDEFRNAAIKFASEVEKAGLNAERVLEGLKARLEEFNQGTFVAPAITEATKTLFDKEQLNTLVGMTALQVDITNELQKQAKIKNDLAEKEIGLQAQFKSQLRDLARANDLIKLQVKGYTEQELASKGLRDTISDIVEEHNNLDDLQKLGLEKIKEQEILTLALAGNYEAIREKLGVVESAYDKTLEIAKQVNEVEAKRLERLQEISSEIKGTLSESIQGVLGGEQDFESIFTNIADLYEKKMTEAFANSLSEDIVNTFNLGGIFGEGLEGIEGMFKTPMEKHVYDMRGAFDEHIDGLYKANTVGNKELKTTLGGDGGAGGFLGNLLGGGRRGGLVGGLGSLLSSLGRGRQVGTRTVNGQSIPIFEGETSGASGFSSLLGTMGNFLQGKGSSGFFGKLGAVAGYAQIAGAFSDAKGTFQGAYTTPSGQRLGANRNAPYQYAGIALAPEVRSGWSKKDQLSQTIGYYMDPLGLMKQNTGFGKFNRFMFGMPWLKGWGKGQEGQVVVDEQVVEATNNVASKVEAVQKEVGWVNRNLVDLKQTMVYIMQESAYFSENSNVTENFAINASRGG